MIDGNTRGVKKIHLDALDALEKRGCSAFCDADILETICRLSALYNRELTIGISRGGTILTIAFGDHRSVGIPAPKNERPMSGVRYLHTHPRGTAELSDEDYSCLERVRADAMTAIAVGDDGTPLQCRTAFRTPQGIEELVTTDTEDEALFSALRAADLAWKKAAERTRPTAKERERAVLVGVNATRESLEELAELADSAGAAVVGTLTQSIRPTAATVIGSGKLGELAATVQIEDADCVIFDCELTGAQAVRLEDALGVKVIDRSNLIMDIFAARARTTEGKLQVELAQLRYNLPRLIGAGGRMDRLRSGIGMRGPGEKKLETDRRLLRARIRDLERDLEKLTRERALRRRSRAKGGAPTVALVGYTNAGKSTLMRALSGADVYVEDKLFATLDPLTRKVRTERGTFLLTDTVGFVDKLPHHLIDAFSSTLEEARLADVLLVVADCADPEQARKRAVVEQVLGEIGAGDVPRLYVANKSDKAGFSAPADAIAIGAATGAGIDGLLARLTALLFPPRDGT